MMVDFDEILEEIQVKKLGEARLLSPDILNRITQTINDLTSGRERMPNRITIILLMPHEE